MKKLLSVNVSLESHGITESQVVDIVRVYIPSFPCVYCLPNKVEVNVYTSTTAPRYRYCSCVGTDRHTFRQFNHRPTANTSSAVFECFVITNTEYIFRYEPHCLSNRNIRRHSRSLAALIRILYPFRGIILRVYIDTCQI